MLKITQDAQTLLAEARASAGAPETSGVRFFLAASEDNGKPQITFKFVPRPEPADDVVADDGIPVYVAPEVSETVGEAILEAQNVEGASRLVPRRG